MIKTILQEFKSKDVQEVAKADEELNVLSREGYRIAHVQARLVDYQNEEFVLFVGGWTIRQVMFEKGEK